ANTWVFIVELGNQTIFILGVIVLEAILGSQVSFTEENVLLLHVHFMTNICAVVGGKARFTLPCILHWLLS
ncbi:hypothetical protein FRX31_003135, partial [Thalictrum thalictroides]